MAGANVVTIEVVTYAITICMRFILKSVAEHRWPNRLRQLAPDS